MDDDSLDFNPEDDDKPILPSFGRRKGPLRSFSSTSFRAKRTSTKDQPKSAPSGFSSTARPRVRPAFAASRSCAPDGSLPLSSQSSPLTLPFRHRQEQPSASSADPYARDSARSLAETSSASSTQLPVSSQLSPSERKFDVSLTKKCFGAEQSTTSLSNMSRHPRRDQPSLPVGRHGTHQAESPGSSRGDPAQSQNSARSSGTPEKHVDGSFLFSKLAHREPAQRQFAESGTKQRRSTPSRTKLSQESEFSSHRSSISSITHPSTSTKEEPRESTSRNHIGLHAAGRYINRDAPESSSQEATQPAPSTSQISVASASYGDRDISSLASVPSRPRGVTNNGDRKNSRRRESRHRAAWLNNDDDEVDCPIMEGRKVAAMTSATGMGGIVPVTRVTAGRADVYALAEAGNTQFFRDEVLWCCSNIVESNSKERLQAAKDLAILISDTSAYPPEAIAHRDVLKAFTDVLAFCKTLFVEDESDGNGGDDSEAELKRFVALVLHFLAMACCEDDSAGTKMRFISKNMSHRFVRKSLLSSLHALEGLVVLVLADPRVSQIRGKKRKGLGVLGASVDRGHVSKRDPSTPQSAISSSVGSTPESFVSFQESTTATLATNPNADLDPTRAGRVKRAKKRRIIAYSRPRLSPITEDRKPHAEALIVLDKDDDLSFPVGRRVEPKAADDWLSFKDYGSSGVQSKVQKKLATLMRRVAKTVPSAEYQHNCGTDTDIWLESMPLLALTRIITGKRDGSPHSPTTSAASGREPSTFATYRLEDDTKTTQIDELLGGWGLKGGTAGNDAGDNKSCDNQDQFPWANRQLAESGIVSLLATAVADVLAAVHRMLHREGRKRRRSKPACVGCIHHVSERLRRLVSIVDVACLFSDENRVLFCQEGYSADLGGYLIVGLVSTLGKLRETGKLFEGMWGDIALEALRALLTLTHENKVAARELETVLGKAEGASCLHEVAAVLYASALGDKVDSPGDKDKESDGKQKYDCSIFCLNILTNYLEIGGSGQTLHEIRIAAGGGKQQPFLAWVSAWLVGQTSSFRDAVTESTFGSSPENCKHSNRILRDNEDEKLVMAGNGFVLLAWALVREAESSSRSPAWASLSALSSSPRQPWSRGPIWDVIESELPGTDSEAKVTYLRNTLKAFCNFYHASVGDLSLVIVEPVKRLLDRLHLCGGKAADGPAQVQNALSSM